MTVEGELIGMAESAGFAAAMGRHDEAAELRTVAGVIWAGCALMPVRQRTALAVACRAGRLRGEREAFALQAEEQAAVREAEAGFASFLAGEYRGDDPSGEPSDLHLLPECWREL